LGDTAPLESSAECERKLNKSRRQQLSEGNRSKVMSEGADRARNGCLDMDSTCGRPAAMRPRLRRCSHRAALSAEPCAEGFQLACEIWRVFGVADVHNLTTTLRIARRGLEQRAGH